MEAIELEHLFNSNLPRAYGLAEQYCKKFNSLLTLREDLKSEAACGLWEGCLRYEPSPNNAPWTFLYWRVRGSIVDFCRKEKIFLRDRELKSGRKNYQMVSLSEGQRENLHHGGRHGSDSSQKSMDKHFSFGKVFYLVDDKADLVISKIEVGRIIDSGTNGMSADKKKIMKDYFCEGMNVPDMATENGTAKWYAWAAIREGVDELKKQRGVDACSLQK